MSVRLAPMVLAERAGDDPMARLLLEHRGMIHGLLMRFRIPPEVGEDLIQNCCLRFWQVRETVVSPPDWFWTTLWRQCASYLRSQRRRERRFAPIADVPEDQAVAHSGRDQEARELRADLRREISTLPPRARQVLFARSYWGLSEGETAALVGCAPASVRQIHRRARQRLAAQLYRQGYRPGEPA